MLLDLYFHHDDDPAHRRLMSRRMQEDQEALADAAALLRDVAARREADHSAAIATAPDGDGVAVSGQMVEAVYPGAPAIAAAHFASDAHTIFTTAISLPNARQRNASALALILAITETLQ